jgi:phosphatidylglycerol lysyltransferase
MTAIEHAPVETTRDVDTATDDRSPLPPGLQRRAMRRWLPALVVAAIAVLALGVLQKELRAYHLHDITGSLRALPTARLLLACALTALGFVVLAGCDALALRYLGRRLPLRRLAFASSVGYAFSQLLSFTALTGGSIRYRLWSRWGLSASEVAQAVAFDITTSWLGIIALGGATLMLSPRAESIPAVVQPGLQLPLGVALLAVVLCYLLWSVVRRPLVIRGWRITPPVPSLALAQLGLATLDWIIAGAVLFALLPAAPRLPATVFFEAFLLAQVAGILSQLPGGIGVFESVLVLLLRPFIPAPEVLGALIAYRAVYYLAPFAVASVALAAFEFRRRRIREPEAVRAVRRWLSGLLPDALSVLTFGAGVVMLVSGATPSASTRLAWLDTVLPLGVIEVSHFVGSLVGVVLLILARGLHRRLDAAYHLAVVALGIGIAASLLKGADYLEALVLTAVLGLVLPARRHFYRRAALTSEPWSPGWVVAVLLVLGGTAWLGLFAYQHVDYSRDLWWRFTFYGDAPRFLRAMTGVFGVVLAFALTRLLGPAKRGTRAPTRADIDRAAAIAHQTGKVNAYLATVGDKAVLFGRSRGLLMFAISGRSWVALGDPIGAPEERAELAWRFKEMADRHAGWPVFYEAGRESLPLFVDLGLTLVKLGEEARVPLAGFSLDGHGRKELRRTVRGVEKAGCVFEIVAPKDVPALMPELRRVSDAWLAEKNTREKGFSLGHFDDAYLCRFPAAVVRRNGRVLAFANVWPSATREELSVDLMRHEPDAPRGVMEYVMIELMLWGKSEGYAWFNLGMAPLAGLVSRALAPRWSSIGRLIYRRGEHFYNFRGLREYKAKFDPVWEPKYLASPGGLALPRILANIATLIGGGLRGVVAK